MSFLTRLHFGLQSLCTHRYYLTHSYQSIPKKYMSSLSQAAISKLHAPLRDLVSGSTPDLGKSDKDQTEVTQWLEKVAQGEAVKADTLKVKSYSWSTRARTDNASAGLRCAIDPPHVYRRQLSDSSGRRAIWRSASHIRMFIMSSFTEPGLTTAAVAIAAATILLASISHPLLRSHPNPALSTQIRGCSRTCVRPNSIRSRQCTRSGAQARATKERKGSQGTCQYTRWGFKPGCHRDRAW